MTDEELEFFRTYCERDIELEGEEKACLTLQATTILDFVSFADKLSLAKRGLEEAKVAHNGISVVHADMVPCDSTLVSYSKCDCGADEHNRRIEEVLREIT